MVRSLTLCLMLLFVLVAPPGHGQPNLNPTDTNYVGELLRKGEAVETKQPQSALINYQKAYQTSRKIGYTKGYFESVRLLVYLLNNLGRQQAAHPIAQEALQRAKQDTSRRNLGISYFALANTYLFSGQLNEAVPNYRQAAHYMRLIGKLKNVAVINQNLGYIYEQQHMYDQALLHYKRSLAVNRADTLDRRSIAIDYFSMANVLSRQRKVAESRTYYRYARRWMDPANDLDMLVNLYNNVAYEFSEEGRYDSALHYQHEALKLSRQAGNPRHELHILMALAQTHNRMKQFGTARNLLDASHAIARRHKVGLAEFRNIYREYYVANAGLHNYKAALDWSDRHDRVDSVLNNQETKDLLTSYEAQLRTAEARQKLAEKQRQIDRLENEREQQRLWLSLAGLAGLLVAGGLVLSWLYYRQRQQTAERERELALVQSELQGQQKERLRISKEMHDDLGASLTAIGLLSEVVKTRMGAATTPEVEKISAISSAMVTAMNEIIWSLNTRNDSINGLIAYVRAYASEFLDDTSLSLRPDVTEAAHDLPIRGGDRRNVFLTVKEALNNVVKHAQATRVTLRIRPEPGQLVIEVCDNGRGFVPNAQTSLRNGLANMQNRMAESGGSCLITPTPTGTCVEIRYPYAFQPDAKILQTQYGG